MRCNMNVEVLEMISDLKKYVITVHTQSYNSRNKIERSDLQNCLFMVAMSLNSIESYIKDEGDEYECD